MRSVGLLLFLLAGPVHGSDPGSVEFFESKIRPVLHEHCLPCHGGDAKKGPKGGLRMTGRDELLKGGDSGPAIVSGDPTKSRLIDAVGYLNPDLQMPPKGKLPAAAIADLTAWVKAGATWPKDAAAAAGGEKSFDLPARKAGHWAWHPIKALPAPGVKDAAWPRTDSDRFLLAKLEAKGLKPAPDSDPYTLLRRVYLALTGLPPTPAEVEAFAKDPRLEPVVDRLLASPHFGERWARHWLDLVRYAETKGHEFDSNIPNAYLYRDYVIRAFNADVPYDKFVTEHVAGDLIREPRTNPADQSEESIVGTAFWFLGEEVHSPVDIRQDQADRFDNRIDVFGKTFLGLTVACARCHDHKFDAISTKDYYSLFAMLESSGYRLARVDRRAALERWPLLNEFFRMRPRPRQDQNIPPGPNVVVDYARPAPGQWLTDGPAFGGGPVPVGGTWYAKGEKGYEPRRAGRGAAYYNRVFDDLKPSAGTLLDAGALGKRMRAGRTLRTPAFVIDRGPVHVLVRGAGTSYAAVAQHSMISGPLHGKLIKEIPKSADFRWVTHDLSNYRGLVCHLEFTPAGDSEFAVAAVVQGETPPADPESIPEPVSARNAVATEWTKSSPKQSRLVPAMWDGTTVTDHVFARGNPKTPGEAVAPRFLEAVSGVAPFAMPGSGRLELAGRMTDPAVTPLVPRVMVNRVWHHLFGRGIVPSVDNFGVMGEAPTHPELLDFLADRFAKDGWSVKKLIRTLVLSRAYAMSSAAEPEAEKNDPKNDLFHRANIRRLDAEVIRDSMLAVSAKLDPKLYGPSVPIHLTPFMDGRGKPGKSGPLDGEGRRSIYVEVRRNFLNPFLLAFDFPIPFSTVGRRQVSNVPAQALILMNDPFVHEMANAWGKKLAGSGDDGIRTIYLAALTRPATDEEVKACRDFLGESPGEKQWAELAHAVFNAKEFVFQR